MGVNVFNRDRRHIHEDTHGKREAAQRHDIDRLPHQPKRQHRGKQRNRNVEHHDEGASPIAQEQQDHDAGENSAQ
jgi:hypothetical protein